MKYKKGDKVRIVKPKDLEYGVWYTDHCFWNYHMDGLIGSAHILDKNIPNHGWWLPCPDGFCWNFLEDWLEYANKQKVKFNDAMSIL